MREGVGGGKGEAEGVRVKDCVKSKEREAVEGREREAVEGREREAVSCCLPWCWSCWVEAWSSWWVWRCRSPKT